MLGARRVSWEKHLNIVSAIINCKLKNKSNINSFKISVDFIYLLSVSFSDLSYRNKVFTNIQIDRQADHLFLQKLQKQQICLGP